MAAERDESFGVDRRGRLVRTVTPARGEPYEHTCPRESFEQIAHAVDEAGERGCTIETLHDATGLPFSRIATALAFLKERGCVVTEGKWNYAAPGNAGGGVHLDAMVEYHALREKGAE